MIKQDELTQLNRDNARLLAEARQQHKDLQTQQRQLEQAGQTQELRHRDLAQAERENSALRERCDALQKEVSRLSEDREAQTQHTQSLQENLVEALAQLKLVSYPIVATGSTSQT